MEPTIKPIVYMLCGLTGSGKTTYAQELAKQGYVRLSLDEEVHRLHERDQIAYPDKYLEYEEEAKESLKQRLQDSIDKGQQVVLDYGFWKRSDRDHYKNLIENLGGAPKLVYFQADPQLLISRLHQRNERTDANALTVTETMLRDFIARFEEPRDENKEIIPQE